MSINPFESVKDYPGMLNKIATYTFFASLGAVWLLRKEFYSIEDFLKPFSLPIPLASGLEIPIGTILPAFLFALLSRIIKLHDRISDLLRIRERFDVRSILLPMAAATGANLKVPQIRRMKQEREALMNDVFYEYASSTPDKAQIDFHYIEMALDQWSWYWIMLEATFIAFILAVVSLFTKHWLVSASLFFGIVSSLGLILALGYLCASYSLREVEEILGDPKRKAAITERFRAL